MEQVCKCEWCVYKHTTPSGKVYIGITSNTPERRWGHGCNYESNAHFWNAIQKYTWENIQHEVLYTGLSKEEASEKEKSLIALYKSHDPAFGYNLTFGGESFEFPEHVKEKLRHPKNLSDEQRKKLSERGKVQAQKYLVGRVRTKEEIEKMANAKRGVKQSKEAVAKRVEGLKKRWQSQGGLSEEHRKKISKALTGRTHSFEAKERMRAAKAPELNPRSRHVIQKTKNNEMVAEYCSVREAGRQTGTDYTSIVRVCNGDRLKTAGGFKWEYAPRGQFLT